LAECLSRRKKENNERTNTDVRFVLIAKKITQVDTGFFYKRQIVRVYRSHFDFDEVKSDSIAP